jgi:hypothetical protein
VKLERKHAVLLLTIAAWNVVTYVQFTRALATTEEDRPTGYYVAHGVLIVVNLVIAFVLARLGLRAWKATSSGGRARGEALAEPPSVETSDVSAPLT